MPSEMMPIWGARCYEPLLGWMLTDLRARAAECCAAGLSGGTVLDVCCGPGGLCPALCQRGLRVTGIDLDEHMLREALRREGDALRREGDALRREGDAQRRERDAQRRECMPQGAGAGALWALADAQQLPFASGSFDAAVVCLALHAMPWETATAALAEMRRVTRAEGGRVVVADYCLPERNLACPAGGVAFALEWMVGGEHYRCYREFMRRGGVEGLLYSQGLRVARREHTLGGAGMVALCFV